MIRRALPRQTRWYQNCCSAFTMKDFIVQNLFWKFWNFDPWWLQVWPEPKNDRNDFELIFRELSNAVFCFVLRCARAEIDGGVQTPPSGMVENPEAHPGAGYRLHQSVSYQFDIFKKSNLSVKLKKKLNLLAQTIQISKNFRIYKMFIKDPVLQIRPPEVEFTQKFSPVPNLPRVPNLPQFERFGGCRRATTGGHRPVFQSRHCRSRFSRSPEPPS